MNQIFRVTGGRDEQVCLESFDRFDTLLLTLRDWAGDFEGYVMLASYAPRQAVKPADTPQGKAVLSANVAEMEWMKRPKDPTVKEEYEKWVSKDGQRYEEISKRIGRYINGGHYLVKADHDVTVTKVERIDDKTYKVTTVETTHIVREDGIEWSQAGAVHTYKIVLEGKDWKVFSDDF